MEGKPRGVDGLISMVPIASVWRANCVAGRVEGPVFVVVRANSGWSSVEMNWRTVGSSSAWLPSACWTRKAERREIGGPLPAHNFSF